MDENRAPLATYEGLAKMIDHSLVRPELTDAEIVEGCQIAKAYEVASVSVRPSDVDTAVRVLQGSDVAVGSSGRISARVEHDRRPSSTRRAICCGAAPKRSIWC